MAAVVLVLKIRQYVWLELQTPEEVVVEADMVQVMETVPQGAQV